MFGGEIATSVWLNELAQAGNVVRLEELSFFGGTRSGRGEIDPKALARFCSAEHLKTLARLDLTDLYHTESPDDWAGFVRILGSAVFARNLRALHLGSCMLGEEAAAMLANTPAFARIEELDLAGCDELPGGGVQAILDSPFLTNLRDVVLPYGPNHRVLAACPRLAKWQSLGLQGNLGGRSAPREWETLFTSPYLCPTRLSVFASVSIPPAAVEALLRAPWVSGLEVLRLFSDHLDISPFQKLFASGGGPTRLRSFALPPSSAFLELLVGWPGLAGLTELSFDFPFSYQRFLGSLAPLFGSPHLTRALDRLDVSEACRTQNDVQALAECKGLAGLRHLGFGYNSLNGPKMAALAASPWLRHLESLHLGSESDYTRVDEGTVVDAFRILALPETFPRLRDVVVGSETEDSSIELLRERFGPRLRIWADC
jgi:hypothetical protein